MKTIRRLSIPAGAACLLLLVVMLAAPRVAHAVTAALVQVVNTSANPVPVTMTQPATTVVERFDTTLPADGTPTQFGPVDISPYSTIRLYADPAFMMSQATFELIMIDLATGNQFVLDTFTVTGEASVTRSYDVPGTSLEIRAFNACLTCPAPSIHGILFGR